MNDKRNVDQQKVRKVFIDDYKNGIERNDKMYLNALQRPLGLVEKLPEKDSEGQIIPKNVAENKKNEARFERLVDFVDRYLGAVVGKGSYGPDTRATHPLSTLRRQNGKGQVVVSEGTEALILVTMENAWKKWVYEASLEIDWGRNVSEDDRKTEDYKKHCPPILWTTKKGGSNRFGGWLSEGKARFKKVRGLIKKARAQEHIGCLDKKVCEAIKKRHEALKMEERPRKRGQ